MANVELKTKTVVESITVELSVTEAAMLQTIVGMNGTSVTNNWSDRSTWTGRGHLSAGDFKSFTGDLYFKIKDTMFELKG